MKLLRLCGLTSAVFSGLLDLAMMVDKSHNEFQIVAMSAICAFSVFLAEVGCSNQ